MMRAAKVRAAAAGGRGFLISTAHCAGKGLWKEAEGHEEGVMRGDMPVMNCIVSRRQNSRGNQCTRGLHCDLHALVKGCPQNRSCSSRW
jgi:hypothetical protein